MRSRSWRRRDADRGAAAVEFALVVPLLLAILFGIVDYGLWFNDSLNMRQGVREAARQGIVGDAASFGSCPADDEGLTFSAGTSPDIEHLMCQTKQRIGLVTGADTLAIKIDILDRNGAAGAYAQGNTLRVCAQDQHPSLIGFVPFPSDGVLSTTVDTRIEAYTPPAEAGGVATSVNTPGSLDWSWCS